MARAKFKIENEKDSSNFLTYIRKNEEVLRRDILIDQDGKGEGQANRESAEFWETYNKITQWRYIIDTAPEEQHEEQTKLLYMLPYSRIQKIKTSLRAKRKSKYEKRKKQLTIDAATHMGLSKYAKSYNITLSEAIEKLLDKVVYRYQ